MTRRYVYEISMMIGPDRDIPAPDVNTNPQVMAWILDTYSTLKGYSVPSVVTGKPLELGGSLGRLEATGKGVFTIAQESAKHLNFPIEGARVVIQGCGNVGGTAAQFFDRAGAKVIAISDYQGGIYNPKGLNVPEALSCRNQYSCFITHEGPGWEEIYEQGAFGVGLRHSHPGGNRKPDYPRECPQNPGEDDRRGGQRADDAGGG